MPNFSCKSCGVSNRLPAYSVASKPRCGKCGAGLPEKSSIQILRALYRFRFLAPWAFVICSVLAFPTILRLVDGPGIGERLAKFSCPTIAMPTNGPLMSWSSNPTVANLSIDAQSGSNYFLKVEDAETHLPIVTYFVSGGSTFRTPIGSFRTQNC